MQQLPGGADYQNYSDPMAGQSSGRPLGAVFNNASSGAAAVVPDAIPVPNETNPFPVIDMTATVAVQAPVATPAAIAAAMPIATLPPTVPDPNLAIAPGAGVDPLFGSPVNSMPSLPNVAAPMPVADAAVAPTLTSAGLPTLGAAPLIDNLSGITSGSNSVQGMTNLIDAVVAKGLIQPPAAEEVKSKVVTMGKSLEQALVEDGKVNEDEVYKVKAEMSGLEFVDLGTIEIDPNVLNKIPSETARKFMAIAFAVTPSGIKVAMADPTDLQKTRYLTTLLGASVEAVYSSPRLIRFITDNKYGAQVGSEVTQALESVDESAINLTSAVSEVTDLESNGDLANAPVAKIVNMILEYAIRYKASDIHIEPRENKLSVRFRIFGVLAEKLTLPSKLIPAAVSRIKILANLKIDEHRVPQDGRFQVKLDKDMVDLRVSIVPTVYGEKIVMRLLEKGGGSIDLPSTGLRGYAFKVFTENLHKTQGILLVTGPTGSGKTQTLASCLKILNTPQVNIMTLEDPVEIRVDGVNQVQVNGDVGLTFARGLRSFLRQDPNIIMVGEIRDAETANLAVQAALTGHLVLATLHTNSASAAPSRLVDMEVEPFLLASTLNIVVAQRLVRKICNDCKEAYYVDGEVAKQIHAVLDGIKSYDMFKLQGNQIGNPADPVDDKIVLYRGKGCSKCNDTGYVGRLGIFEAIDVNESISKLILQHATTQDMQKQAEQNGMLNMLQDGFMKAVEGITTLEEVLRVQTV